MYSDRTDAVFHTQHGHDGIIRTAGETDENGAIQHFIRQLDGDPSQLSERQALHLHDIAEERLTD